MLPDLSEAPSTSVGVHVSKHLMQEKKRPYREWLEAAEECKRREKKIPLRESLVGTSRTVVVCAADGR
jgi:hypothetical protein